MLAASTLGGCFLFFPRRGGSTAVGNPAQPGRIEGRLVDEAGRPVVGASATIPEAGQVTTLSGTDGRFTLMGLTPGTYYVRVSKEGYLAGSYGVTVEGAGAAQLEAQLQLTTGNLHKGGVPKLCEDCHVLHNPTPTSHLLRGSSPLSPCFASGCHAAGGRGPTINETIYRDSPHGPAWLYNSNTQQAWTGQPASERGNCNTCHEPHGISGPPFMLKKGIKDADGTLRLNDVCFECHSAPGTGNTARWPGKTVYLAAANLHVNPPTVPPTTHRTYPGTKYAMGDCGNCHLPHGQSFGGTIDPHMLRDQGYKLCLKCHTDKLDTSGAGHNGNCLICHDPHNVTKDGALLKVKNPSDGTSFITKPTQVIRAETWTAGSYCTGCHKASPPSWLPVAARNPYAATTGFWNTWDMPKPPPPDRNLHNVHVNRVWASNPHHYGVAGDNNKVRCGQCHAPHQTTLTRQLSGRYFTSISPPYGGDWQSKPGCGVKAGCHTCDWCHQPPGNPGGPCQGCGYHPVPGNHRAVAY
jgi:predicted CXXCH cytochrome family protein